MWELVQILPLTNLKLVHYNWQNLHNFQLHRNPSTKPPRDRFYWFPQ